MAQRPTRSSLRSVPRRRRNSETLDSSSAPTPQNAGELDALAADWSRLGVLFGVEPSHALVDVELLICDTARVAPADERLFVCAASWIAEYHGFVNGRRLSALAGALDPEGSAVLGALLSLAKQAASTAPELEAPLARCRPLAKARPLFLAMRSMRVLTDRVRRNALPIFAAWGLWHDDQTIKPAAIRPEAWLLTNVPELRVRALLGPSVEADLMSHALGGGATVREVARTTLSSYAAVHGAADRLVWRGLVVRERMAQSQVLRPTAFAIDVLQRRGRADALRSRGLKEGTTASVQGVR